MKIQYLLDTHDSIKGDIKEVQDLQANILILRGFAKIHVEQSTIDKVKTDKKA